MKVKVKEFKQEISSNICLFSKDIFNELKLVKDELYTIHLGQLSQSVYAEPGASAENFIYLSKDVFNNFLLYEDINLNVWRQDNNIYLGPVVGIFVSLDNLPNITKGDERPDAVQYIKASMAEGCLCYYFSTKDIDWEQNKIKGYTFISVLNKWDYGWFPIPNVIYDRHRNYFEGRKKELLEKKRKRFSNYNNLHFINSINYLGGKWQQYKLLSKYSEIKDFFPETIFYKSFNDVIRMLDKHKFVFIKSFFGSLGYGVISIEQENKQYRVNYYDNVLKEVLLKDIAEVKKLVEHFREGRRFIIQQGIRLMKYKNRNFDVRVFLQKDENGTWKSTRNFVRIAQGNFTLTNHSLGSDFAIYDHLLPFLNSPLGKEAIPDTNKITETAIKIANCIDKEFGVEGELGLDLGIDAYGKVWFIEVNEKPGLDWDTEIADIFKRNYIKLLFEIDKVSGDYLKIDPNNINGVLPQALNIFRYAKFLSIKVV